jgi:hypothetical protein
VFVGGGGGAEFGRDGRSVDLGEPGAQQAGVGPGEEQRVPQPEVGDAVAVGVWDAVDEPASTNALLRGAITAVEGISKPRCRVRNPTTCPTRCSSGTYRFR